MSDTTDNVAKLSLTKFSVLSKNGKPEKGRQWTVLASFVKQQGEDFRVVALGTGSTCLGFSQTCPNGRLIHDSHAEVIARRAFNRYLYDQLSRTYDSSLDTIFSLNDESGQCSLKENVKFHFYSSQSPCGDASIYRLNENQTASTNTPESLEVSRKRPLLPQDDRQQDKRLKSSEHLMDDDDNFNGIAARFSFCHNNINRTGAKNVPGGVVDPHDKGESYHEIGLLRTKPGRGIPTHSMCCSDKLMKWNIMGCQGSLVTFFLDKPIYISSFTISGGNEQLLALRRALFGRVDTEQVNAILQNTSYKKHHPILAKTNLEFVFSKPSCLDSLPCGSAVAWCDVGCDPHEVLAKNGLLLGVTAKHKNSIKAVSSISRLKLFCSFKKLLAKLPPTSSLQNRIGAMDEFTLSKHKELLKYTKLWKSIQTSVFPLWVKHSRSLDRF